MYDPTLDLVLMLGILAALTLAFTVGKRTLYRIGDAILDAVQNMRDVP